MLEYPRLAKKTLLLVCIFVFIVCSTRKLSHSDDLKHATWTGSATKLGQSSNPAAVNTAEKAPSEPARDNVSDELEGTYGGYTFPKPYKLEPEEVRERYEFYEVWRNEDSMTPMEDGLVTSQQEFRPRAPGPERFEHAGDYLKQFVVADYRDNSLVDDVFVLIKTGAETQWQRMPSHVYTTFTRIKHFAIYSDLAGSIAGHEIIDIISDLPIEVRASPAFLPHHVYKQMRGGQWGIGPSAVKIDGGWALDRYKNLPAFYHAYCQKPDAKWYFMIDDDTFVFWDNLFNFLKGYDHTKPYYLGTASNIASLKFAHGGSGIVLSHGAMEKLFSDDEYENKRWLDKYAKMTVGVCCGDFMVARALVENQSREKVYLDKVGMEVHKSFGGPFQGQNIQTMYFIPGLLGVRLITAHKIDARNFERLYTYDRLMRAGKREITMAQMYTDFVLPYITDERENWRLLNADNFFGPAYSPTGEIVEDATKAYFSDNGTPVWPYRSKEDCKRACQLDESCWAWTHAEMQCEHSTIGIILGEAVTKYSKAYNQTQHYTTGWMIDKIRKTRTTDNTDPLMYDPISKRYNDNDDTSEGWYYRKLADTGFSAFE